MRTLLACLALVPTAALAGVGCGSGDETQDPPGGAEVRQAFARFDAAQAAGDAGTACRSLVAVEEQGRVEIPGGGAERDRESKRPEAGVCERAFMRAAKSRRELRDVAVDVTEVTVKGDEATVATRTRVTRSDGTDLDQAATRRLVRLEGRWRVVITEE